MRVDFQLFGVARDVAQRAMNKYAARNGTATLGPHGPAVVTAVLEALLEELQAGRLVAGQSPADLLHQCESRAPMAKAKVVGGPFDGQDTDAEAIHKVVLTPAERLAHYELVYQYRGSVTEQEAEQIVGRKLDG